MHAATKFSAPCGCCRETSWPDWLPNLPKFLADWIVKEVVTALEPMNHFAPNSHPMLIERSQTTDQ
jgi:hypothetical protein